VPRPVPSADLPATARIEPAISTAGSLNDQLVEIFFDRVPMGVAVFDRETRLLRCNRTWAGFFGHYLGVPADTSPRAAPWTTHGDGVDEWSEIEVN